MSADQLDRPEEYVHLAVDRRICVIAGATMNKKMIDQNGTKICIYKNNYNINSKKIKLRNGP